MKIQFQVIFSFWPSYSQSNETIYFWPKTFITVNRRIRRAVHNLQIYQVRSYPVFQVFHSRSVIKLASYLMKVEFPFLQFLAQWMSIESEKLGSRQKYSKCYRDSIPILTVKIWKIYLANFRGHWFRWVGVMLLR